MNALRYTIAPLARKGHFFCEIKVAGNYQLSIAMITRVEAGIAAIDCVTHGLMARHDPASVAGTRVLAQIHAALALPYVTGRQTALEDQVRLRTALGRAATDRDLAPARDALMIQGFAVLSLPDHHVLLEMEAGPWRPAVRN